jgi:hypothetical protein
MSQDGLLTFIYGVIILSVLYLAANMIYSVYYTPGVSTLYNSPVTQKLFPNAMNKLFPTWGYNKLGLFDGQPFKFGQGQFWPESGKGYTPNKLGYPGASPSGGLRKSFDIPSSTQVGFWGYTPKYNTIGNLDIYDNSSQHVNYKTPIGWWGSE